MSTLDLETFAHALAHVGHFGPSSKPEVLRRLEISEPAFDRAALDVPRAIAHGLAQGDEQPASLFTTRLKATKAELEDKRPELAKLAPLRQRSQEAPASEITSADPAEAPTLDPTSADLRRPPLPFRPDVVVRAPSFPVATADPYANTIGPGGTLEPIARPTSAETLFSSWTVERYANYTADRRLGDPEEVRAAYAITDDAYERALVTFMNHRLSATPTARDRWMALVAARLAEIGARGRA